MIEVTDDMIDKVMQYFNNPENAKQSDRDWIAGAIKLIIELHEANNPKPEPLSDDEISKILFLCRKGKMFPYSFARDIEQAHGIGVTK